MNTGTIIIGVIILFACFSPLIIVYINRKRKEKAFLNSLFELAQSRNCSITNYDLWTNSAIGIDKNARRIFFMRMTSSSNESKEINLADVQKCRVVNIKTAYSEKGDKDAVGKLELVFTFNDKNTPEKLLEFYNTKHDNLTLSGELQLVEKWEKIVKNEISSIGNKKTN